MEGERRGGKGGGYWAVCEAIEKGESQRRRCEGGSERVSTKISEGGE